MELSRRLLDIQLAGVAGRNEHKGRKETYAELRPEYRLSRKGLKPRGVVRRHASLANRNVEIKRGRGRRSRRGRRRRKKKARHRLGMIQQSVLRRRSLASCFFRFRNDTITASNLHGNASIYYLETVWPCLYEYSIRN